MKEKTTVVNKEFDMQILFTVLKRHWWTPILLILLFWTFAFFYLRYTKPVYDSTMLIQLGSNDNAKDVMEIEGLSKGDDNMSSEVELLKSQLLFNRALETLNFHTSVYSKGAVLTEELYKSGVFQIQPYALNDSSLVDVPIVITVDDKNVIYLDYLKNGVKCGIRGKINQHIINNDFDIIIRTSNLSLFKKTSGLNKVFFQFNSIISLSNRLLPSLQIIPVNDQAKTIQILYSGENTQLCHDIILAVATSFMIFDDEIKRKGSENAIKFIDTQMAILANQITKSKDSIMSIQSNTEFMVPDEFETSVFSEVSILKEKSTEIEDELRLLKIVNLKLKDPNRYEVYKLLPELLGKSFESIVSKKISDLLLLLEQKENLLFDVTEEHSGIKVLNQKILLKSQSVLKSINIVAEKLNQEYLVLNAKIHMNEERVKVLPEKKTEFGRLTKIQELNQQYYYLLTENKFKYSISDAGYTTNNKMFSLPTLN